MEMISPLLIRTSEGFFYCITLKKIWMHKASLGLSFVSKSFEVPAKRKDSPLTNNRRIFI